ncbi:MAG: GlxA family transcriptional regulator [Chloroflexota bacterium]
MAAPEKRIRVSLVATPDAVPYTVIGPYDVLQTFHALVPGDTAFDAEIVGTESGSTRCASGLSLDVGRSVREVDETDLVIVPAMVLQEGIWLPGRYPELVSWIKAMYARGATVSSACSGAMLLAETGLLSGCEATLHWEYASPFMRLFPDVRLRLDRMLLTTGSDGRIVMSGASGSWHDLVLHILARYAGPASAQAAARFHVLQWHADGQAPYISFKEPIDHGDPAVLTAQQWLSANMESPNPVDGMARASGLPARSLKRRFRVATGYTPLVYVQLLRVERAKRALETGERAVDEVSYMVGYEDPAFFRRLFKRVTGMTPGAYRRRFSLPSFIYDGAHDRMAETVGV